MFATITIQYMNTELALYHEYCWKLWLGLSTHSAMSTTSKSILQVNPQTHIFQYIKMQLHQVRTYCTQTYQQFTYPRCNIPLLNTESQ